MFPSPRHPARCLEPAETRFPSVGELCRIQATIQSKSTMSLELQGTQITVGSISNKGRFNTAKTINNSTGSKTEVVINLTTACKDTHIAPSNQTTTTPQTPSKLCRPSALRSTHTHKPKQPAELMIKNPLNVKDRTAYKL